MVVIHFHQKHRGEPICIMLNRRPVVWVLLIVLCVGRLHASAADSKEQNDSEVRLARSVMYLASDELEGRGLGSKGLDLAADYLADQFRAAGLKTDSYDGTPFEKFTVRAGSSKVTSVSSAPLAIATTLLNAAGWEKGLDRIPAKNVIAVLDGGGPHADETIVVGAHYDHLGRGDVGSLAPGSDEVHHGADDNASGAAALLEVASRLAARDKKLPRRIVFIAFTGEERGLYGSAHYVRDPLVPLDQTVAMVNMDMIGRLVDDKLVVYGTDTASQWNKLLDRLSTDHPFKLTRHPEGYGPSDHTSFYAKRIPVLFFFTGTHRDYHRPTDTFEKINVEGMRRITDLVTDTVVAIAEMDHRPTYQDVGAPPEFAKSGNRPYFGSIPDFSQEQPGYVLMGVSKGGPAERAGIRANDTIMRLGDCPISSLDDFDTALRKFKSGDRVAVLVKRGDDELKFEVTLEPPK
jgi:hypothetical protein